MTLGRRDIRGFLYLFLTQKSHMRFILLSHAFVQQHMANNKMSSITFCEYVHHNFFFHCIHKHWQIFYNGWILDLDHHWNKDVFLSIIKNVQTIIIIVIPKIISFPMHFFNECIIVAVFNRYVWIEMFYELDTDVLF